MKLAVFSDVHANLEALELFIVHAKSQGVDGYACLGDMIGYGPNPNECLERIRSLDNLVVIMGNHEWAALHLEESDDFMNTMAHDAIVWTKENLSSKNLEYMAELPDKVEIDQFTLVHASAFQPRNWEYLMPARSSAIMLCLLHSSTPYTLVGHTHRPMMANESGESFFEIPIAEDVVTFSNDRSGKLLINPGSIGQPRGNHRKPSFVIMDSEKNTVSWHCLHEYDPEVTARNILATGLPPECAYYLMR